MLTTIPTPMINQVYRQNLRQSQYTKLAYLVLHLYKFALPSSRNVAQVKSISWTAFAIYKKPNPRHQLLTHFLFTWFHKQLLTVTNWHGTNRQWQGHRGGADVWFYLLRYNIFTRLGVYPFVPTTRWASFNPRQLALLPWSRLASVEELPLPWEDYLNLEWSEYYRLGFQLRCFLPSSLPRWYTKVFTLRSYHYPVVYNTKSLFMLQSFRMVPLKQTFLFDELETARFSLTRRKKRLLKVFKTLLRLGRSRRLVTEFAILYRLQEQLQLEEDFSPAADFFQVKWEEYRRRTQIKLYLQKFKPVSIKGKR